MGWMALVVGPSAYGVIRWGVAETKSVAPKELSLGDAGAIQPGASKLVYLGNDKVIVVRAQNGSFSAAGAVCTHLGCSIRYESNGGTEELACNCHDSRFELDGGLISGPAPRSLRRFGILVQNGEVVLQASPDDDGS